MFPANRVVAILTPVFTAAATVASAWLLKHFPGLPVPSKSQLLAAEIGGATAAVGAALKWLHGHQKWEARIDETGEILTERPESAVKPDPV